MTPLAIQIKDLTFMRGNKLIYDNLNLNIPKGKITGIIGPSGIGKTTLLHLIGGLISPHKGHISVLDNDIRNIKKSKLMEIRKNMGVLFQSGALFTQMSVFDNVAFPLRMNTKLPENIISILVNMKLESVGLRGTSKLMPNELSGGMARRIALARAISLDPSIMMYDEPFTGQDPISLGVILKLIQSLSQALKLTSIVVTHDIQEIMSIADNIVMISNKEVLVSGTPNEIRSHKSPLVQQFLNGEPDGPIPYHYPSLPFLNRQKK
jgi:phospholipid/cholesterol/gamma-HCH transport system ATP-binding protein